MIKKDKMACEVRKLPEYGKQPKSYEELLNVLEYCNYIEGDKDYSQHKFYANMLFRGQHDWDHELRNSLIRKGKEYVNTSKNKDVERNLLRNFKRYAAAYFQNNFCEWEWLTIARHYGLPTRLLDWSFSPMVALHFATLNAYDEPNKDAAVWIVDYCRVHRELLPKKVSYFVNRETARTFTLDMMKELTSKTILPKQRYGNGIIDCEGVFNLPKVKAPYLLFFEAPSIDPRLLYQYSVFSVSDDPTLVLDKYLYNPARDERIMATKIKICRDLKLEIRERLDISNINEKTLFPGCDGIASWLARNYRGRPKLNGVTFEP